jgi:hypothetical protein
MADSIRIPAVRAVAVIPDSRILTVRALVGALALGASELRLPLLLRERWRIHVSQRAARAVHKLDNRIIRILGLLGQYSDSLFAFIIIRTIRHTVPIGRHGQ